MAINLSQYQAVLLDLDGTVYHDAHPLPGAAQLVQKLAKMNVKYACLSNSGASPVQITERLAPMGLYIEPDHIYTAAAAAADWVLQTLAPGLGRKARIFNVATDGLQMMLDGAVDWVNTPGEPCDAVLVAGFYATLASESRHRIALQLLRNGAKLVGLCADRVFPSQRGLEFGSGSVTSMFAYAANTKPFFCGKPEVVFFRELCQRLAVDPEQCLLIGDNLESDVQGGKNVGMKTALCLTGVTRRRDLLLVAQEKRPDFVIEDLTELT